MNARASEEIADEVLAWPGVVSASHRFEGLEFRVGQRQIGHLHGDSSADIPLPRVLRDELVASGRAQMHRWQPESGWVTVPIDAEEGRAEALRLLRVGYDSAVRARERRAS